MNHKFLSRVEKKYTLILLFLMLGYGYKKTHLITKQEECEPCLLRDKYTDYAGIVFSVKHTGYT